MDKIYKIVIFAGWSKFLTIQIGSIENFTKLILWLEQNVDNYVVGTCYNVTSKNTVCLYIADVLGARLYAQNAKIDILSYLSGISQYDFTDLQPIYEIVASGKQAVR